MGYASKAAFTEAICLLIDGSIYVMSITTEWQNAPKGDEGNWIKIRIN